MSYPTFGYTSSYPQPNSQLLTGIPATSPGSTASSSNLSPTCGAEGAASPLLAPRALSTTPSSNMSSMTDPVTGQLMGDCDPSRLAALTGYPRLGGGMAGLGASMYNAAYPSTDQNPYPSIAMENSPFYGSLANPYGMKDGAGGADMSAWSSAALPPTAGYYSYDHPTLAAYGYGGGYDLAARRKNATRESTSTLKAWLNEHKKNPYPTKGEKIMLAIITKMTLTQVSTWFANARRRLKKENKMTWEPKNKLDDEDVDVSDDDEKDNSFNRDDLLENDDDQRKDGLVGHHGMTRSDPDKDDSKEGIPIPPSKPKIWSLADTAVCKTPPPSNPTGQHNPWAAMNHGGFGGLDHNLVRPNPAMAAAALRTNMFGMGRAPDLGGYQGLSLDTKVGLPAHSPSVSAQSGSSELQTDTPPQTPPNGIKLGQGLGINNVMNMNNSPFGYGVQQSQQYPSAGHSSSLMNPQPHLSNQLSPNGDSAKMVLSQQFSINNHTNNLHNGAFSRL